MAEMQRYEEGWFCWADLSTGDLKGARKFYGELFGWSFRDIDTGGGAEAVYVIAELGGRGVGAMAPLNAALKAQGVPSHWLTYIAVNDVDATAAKVEKAGGKLMMSPFDAMDAGRMAIVVDPTGATLALWQAKKHPGAALKNEPGTLCWTELMTTDAKKATAFYTSILPWKTKASPEYTEWQVGQDSIGGMMEMKDPKFAGVPSHWGIYFAVASCDETVARAKKMGAAVMMPPTDIPNVGRFAVLNDPQGAHFNVIQLLPRQQ
jgi:predicted enzyme related to lactoylglutathione lyase